MHSVSTSMLLYTPALCCRIYDAFTGEFLWESDEHEGAGATLWTMPSTPNFCGIYDNSGVWLIRSRKAIDQAYFMANALFPISTNADEVSHGLDESSP